MKLVLYFSPLLFKFLILLFLISYKFIARNVRIQLFWSIFRLAYACNVLNSEVITLNGLSVPGIIGSLASIRKRVILSESS